MRFLLYSSCGRTSLNFLTQCGHCGPRFIICGCGARMYHDPNPSPSPIPCSLNAESCLVRHRRELGRFRGRSGQFRERAFASAPPKRRRGHCTWRSFRGSEPKIVVASFHRAVVIHMTAHHGERIATTAPAPAAQGSRVRGRRRQRDGGTTVVLFAR